jgi:hypothetical protein
MGTLSGGHRVLRVSDGGPVADHRGDGGTAHALQPGGDHRHERHQYEVAAQQAREAERAATLREQERDLLASRIDAAWDDIDRKLLLKVVRQYDLTVKALTDMRGVHKQKAFRDRLTKAGLTT